MTENGGREIKLNLGSGKNYREGYINIEINPRFKSDVLANIMDIEYDEGSIDEVLAQDILDHVTYKECRMLLHRIYAWLKNNGILNIHLPNFKNLIRFAMSPHEDISHEAMCWLYGTDGDQRASYETNIIRWSYTPESIKLELENAGFIVVNQMSDCGGYAMRIIAVKRIQENE